MDLRALLLKLYFNIETAYYEFLDAVDSHLPVYKYLVDPIEKLGYPSFPVYCLAFLFMLVLLFAFATPSSQIGALSLEIRDSQGNGISGATVNILSNNEVIASGVSEVGKLSFYGIPLNKKLTVKVEKSGFEEKFLELDSLPREKVVLSLKPTTATISELQQRKETALELKKTLEELASQGYEFGDAGAEIEKMLDDPQFEKVLGD